VTKMGERDINGQNFNVHREQSVARMLMSAQEIAELNVIGTDIAGFTIVAHAIDAAANIPVDDVASSQVLLVELRQDDPASMQRLVNLCEEVPNGRIIALVRDPSIAVVRLLMRNGLTDVLTLPLMRDELEQVLHQIRDSMQEETVADHQLGKVVAIIPSVGGVGVTTLVTQAGALQAQRDEGVSSEACIIDLDLQFGNAATYLGLNPSLTVADMIEAGPRLDRAMLLAACAKGPLGVRVVAAPPDIMPLEAVSTDQIFNLVDLAAREFRTVFLDLPCNWTNWSLSLIGRTDLIILVIELTVASLRQARRQLNLLASQGLQNVPVMIVANRVQKRLFRTISLADAEQALKHPVHYSIENDFPLLCTAQDQGVLIGDIKSKSKVAKDMMTMLEGCDELLGRSA